MSQTVLNKIIEGKIVAIVRGIPSTKILGLAAALEKGGVNCIEVTFDQSSEEKARDTLAAIRTIKEGLGDKVCVGAGTVMTVEQVRQAAEAGAEYMISPNVDEAVIRATKALGKVSIPGAMTPTETAFAYQCGADIVKLFIRDDHGIRIAKRRDHDKIAVRIRKRPLKIPDQIIRIRVASLPVLLGTL